MSDARPHDEPLDATSRCDRCGAQAYVRATMKAGEILLCAHHGREHGDALHAAAALVHDETGRLTSA